MTEVVTLRQALEDGGAYVVWGLMADDECHEAATALWRDADRESRAALEVALAKEMKFRPQSLRRLPAERIATRLVRMADTLPDTVLFQFLFHLHMAMRREVMIEFLDAVGLSHNEGVLEIEDDTEAPEASIVIPAAQALYDKNEHEAVIYLATLRVADPSFWNALDEFLVTLDEKGSKIG